MVFNSKGNSKGKFFLSLDEKAAATPVTVAPVRQAAPAKPAATKAPAKGDKPSISIQAPAGGAASAATTTAAATSATPSAADTAAPQGKVLTTAEAIAAELAAAQAARPAAVDATFAPDCLTPGGALPMRRRRGGANLAGYRTMAGGLFGKK